MILLLIMAKVTVGHSQAQHEGCLRFWALESKSQPFRLPLCGLSHGSWPRPLFLLQPLCCVTSAESLSLFGPISSRALGLPLMVVGAQEQITRVTMTYIHLPGAPGVFVRF